ncbi:MAG: hypothetical protein AB7P02_19645, partial [Alphaproteobacteria bacterium]
AAAPELTSLPVTAFFFIGEWAGPLVMGALGLAVAAVTGAAAYGYQMFDDSEARGARAEGLIRGAVRALEAPGG